jgi:hypothetical protein
LGQPREFVGAFELQHFVRSVIAPRSVLVIRDNKGTFPLPPNERENQMKKTILIAALFAVAGFANAQNTPSASAPAAKPAVTAEAAKPAETTAKDASTKKVHAKHVKHAKHAAKKGDQPKGTDTVAKVEAPAAAQKAASAPAK